MKTTKELRIKLKEMNSVCGGREHYETQDRLNLDPALDYFGMLLYDIEGLEAKLEKEKKLKEEWKEVAKENAEFRRQIFDKLLIAKEALRRGSEISSYEEFELFIHKWSKEALEKIEKEKDNA